MKSAHFANVKIALLSATNRVPRLAPPLLLARLPLLLLAFALVATGCKHKPPPPTTQLPKPGLTGPGAEVPSPGPGNITPPTSPIPSETPVVGTPTTPATATSTSGIPQGPGHFGWPEDPEALKADTVYFDFDSSVVRPGEKTKVAAVADYLKANAANAVKVSGNCDERGTEEYNRALGERRALAVREELVRLGVDPVRVDTVSFGKDRPADPGHEEAAWRKNRRDEFIVLTPPK